MQKLVKMGVFLSVVAFSWGCKTAQPEWKDARAEFERNAATARQLILDFDAESDAAKAHFADSAIWAPTRFGQAEPVPLDQAWAGWKRMWTAYDLELLTDLKLEQGTDDITGAPDGSVGIHFAWAYTRPATDSTEAKTVEVALYEEWDFNADGQIWRTRLYGDIGAMVAELNR